MIKAIIFDCFGVLVGTGLWNVYQQAGGDLAADREFIEDLVRQDASGLLPNMDLDKVWQNIWGCH